MTKFPDRSTYSRRLLPLAVLTSACFIALSSCFHAKWYEPPEELRASPMFDDYLIEVLMYNENVRSFDHTLYDEYYYIDVIITLDSSKKQLEERDTTRTIAVENLCISSECLDYVYCPPLARDTAFVRQGWVDDEQVYTFRQWFQFGAMDMEDKCRIVEVSLEAKLVDIATDSVIAVDSLRTSMDVKQKAIPAILSR